MTKETNSPLWNLEEDIRKYWQEHEIFKKFTNRENKNGNFFFTEGPPTANGLPHLGHVLTRSIKDAVLRYQWMKGKKVVPYIAGWDCHGLPVEVEVEKEMKFKEKKDIENYGIKKFNEACKSNVYKYKKIWEDMSWKLAYWLDYGHAYTTMSNNYIESVWWALKQLYDNGLIDEGYRVAPYCPRCQTTLSSHEVAQGYDEVEDESIYVKVKLVEEDAYVLIWTTTPWTLPSNMFIAMKREYDYALVECEGEKIYISNNRLPFVMPSCNVLKVVKGASLEGLHYVPIYKSDINAYQIVHADFVTIEEGSGFVHIAPAFGIDDSEVGSRMKVEPLNPILPDGKFKNDFYFGGMYHLKANKKIVEDLKERKLLLKTEVIKHTYPFCWRCDTPLIYYQTRSWFIRVSTKRDDLVNINQGINWIPDSIKEGRFGNFLIEAKDWALSRNRYWGTPLPIWICKNGHKKCIGSFNELKKESIEDIDLETFDPHRPEIDKVIIKCPVCNEDMKRVEYVIDGWFDSGCAPFAQYHYPFENKEIFEKNRPIQFISEAIDQTRGWFYSLHAISSLIFKGPAYNNVVVLGHILDKEGKKLSKSKGNAIDPFIAFRTLGVDSIRLFFYMNKYTNSSRFSEDLVKMSSTRIIMLYLNILNFFKNNADIDHYKYKGEKSEHLLDYWLNEEINKTIINVTESMEKYDLKTSVEEIAKLIENTSNWYIRRSRDRFWSGGKNNAYSTLFRMLYTTSIMLSVFTPHIAEHVYQKLKSYDDTNMMMESVMLESYPYAKEFDETKITQMKDVMEICELGRKIRQDEKIKLKQPILDIVIESKAKWIEDYLALIKEELNAKGIKIVESFDGKGNYKSGKYMDHAIYLNTVVDQNLYLEGIMREIIRRVQIARKEKNLEYDKKIKLYLEGTEDIKKAIELFRQFIERETQAEQLLIEHGENEKKWEINDQILFVSIEPI